MSLYVVTLIVPLTRTRRQIAPLTRMPAHHNNPHHNPQPLHLTHAASQTNTIHLATIKPRLQSIGLPDGNQDLSLQKTCLQFSRAL